MKLLITSIIIALICISGLAACNTNTGNPQKDANARVGKAVGEEVFNAVFKAAVSAGSNYLVNGDGQQAANAAFASASSIDSAAALKRIMEAKAGPQIANVAAQKFADANPQTPAQKQEVVNTIGAALQTAVNQSIDGQP